MRKNRMVWISGCVLVAAGFIWAARLLTPEFFHVPNIHDLMEIGSSVATIVAVIIAGLSVNTWRSQIGAQADHELARRLAITSLRFKEACLVSLRDAHFCFENITGKPNVWPEPLRMKLLERFNTNISVLKASKTELLALLLEVRALWGTQKATEYDVVLSFADRCQVVVLEFIESSSGSGDSEYLDAMLYEIITAQKEFTDEGWVIAPKEARQKLSTLTVAADRSLTEKLMLNPV